jgi:tetratricopeptide (TPR) repeat protein
MTIVQNKLMSKGMLLTLVMFICISVAGCASDSANYLSRGTSYAKKGEFDRAISDYDKAVVRDPENAEIYANRGYVYFLKGEYDGSIMNYMCNLQGQTKNHMLSLLISA